MSYNCLNFKANTAMIKKSIYENDICFFIEHWLNTQEKYLFEELCNGDFHIVFHSDYDNTDGLKKGRPHGGLCWVINKKCTLTAQVFFNQYVSKICIEYDNNILDVFGVWLPFDNNSKDRLCLYKSNISLLEAQIKLNKSTETILLGDFNADLTRAKRFDKLIVRMCNKLKLIDVTDQKTPEYTYKKGEYSAKIDHIFVKCDSCLDMSGKIINDILDTSDHKPVQVCIELKKQVNKKEHIVPEKNNFHKFDWNNNELVVIYKKNVKKMLEKKEFHALANNLNFKEIIDEKISLLTKCLVKCVRQAEQELNGIYKSKSKGRNRYFRPDPEHLDQINLIKELKGINFYNNETKLKYRVAVKKFRKMQRHKVYLTQIKSALNIEKTMQSDKNKFWKDIKKFQKKNSNSTGAPPIPISEFAKYYSNLFSHDDRSSNEEQVEISNKVRENSKRLGNDESVETVLNEVEVEFTIKNLKFGKSIGVDFVSNEMVKHGICNNLIKVITDIYNLMIKYGHTPNDFNTSLVTPIPKNR